jgi:hypothetical protein
VVTHGPDVVLRLPDAAALDAGARMQRVDDAPAKDVVRYGRGRNGETRYGFRSLRLSAAGYLTEQEAEPWTRGTKVRCRSHRDIDLQRIRQQEHPIRDRFALEVDEVYGTPLVGERARPVVEHVGRSRLVGDAEGEIEVRERVARARRERADSRAGDDSLVVLREGEEIVAECVSLLDGEHVA